MDDRAFDRAMRMLAARERPPEAGTRLAQVLSSLPDAPAPRRRMGRRLVPALAAALLICATAIAAQLGLLSFWETNPYRLFHNRERVRPALSVRSLDVTDASGLRLTEVSALDAAWIEGRLTLALRVAARDDASGPVLLEDGFACYTRSGGVDGWPDTGLSVACQPDGDGVLLALQLPADFITASDLPVLTDGDAISLRLEWTVYDPTQARVAIESALLTAPAPTEAEKEEMDP